MSKENVDVVRAANEAFLAGDIEKALDALHPDIEWHATVGGVDRDASIEAATRSCRRSPITSRSGSGLRCADEYLDAGGDDVVVFHHEVAKGREGGVVIETDTGTVNPVQDGRIVRVRSYMDRQQALEAAGLREARPPIV